MGNSPIDRHVAALAARQYGHVTRAQLRELGLSPHAIEYRIKLGRLVIAHRAVYAVGHPRIEPRARAKLLDRLPHAPAAARLRPFVQTPTGITRSMFEDAFQKFVRHFDPPQPQINVPSANTPATPCSKTTS